MDAGMKETAMPRPFADLVSIKEAAEQLGKHPRTLRRWAQLPDGLPTVRLGAARYLHVPTIEKWIRDGLARANRGRRRP
jgi:hypothetical protein